MAGSRYLYKALCQDQSVASARVFDDLKSSIFLEPDNGDARLEVYSPISLLPEDDEFEEKRNGRDATRVQALGLVALKDAHALRQYIATTSGFQAFYIRQFNSYSPLSITSELFEILVSEKLVSPQFKDFILYMGERDREIEIAPPRLRWRPVSNPHAPKQQTNTCECMFGLRFVELNGRGNTRNPTSRWSLRQSAVYSTFQRGGADSTWIFVTISKIAQQRIEEYLGACLQESCPDPFEIYLLLIDTIMSNWRPYLVDLAAETDEHAVRLLGASPDDQGPISMADCGERQALMILDDKMLNATLAIQSTADNVRSQLEFFKSFSSSNGSPAPTNHDTISSMFLEQSRELELLSSRVDALRSRLRGITSLVSSFLDLSNGFALQGLAKESGRENEEMRKLSENMYRLTEKSTQDAAAVKVLTILTLIYLPATVVSNFFSTSFVNSVPSSGEAAHIVVSSDWWIFVAASVPLTLLTLYIWLVWMRIQAYKRYPWWWPRPTDSDIESLSRPARFPGKA